MKVCFASYQAVTMLRGGPRTQILQTNSSLEKLGVEVSLFNTWEEFRRKDFDLIHLFSANIGTYHLARAFHLFGIPMVVTPIFFTRRSAALVRSVVTMDKALKSLVRGVWTDYGLMAEMCTWADAILPNTQEEADLFSAGMGVPADRIAVVPNGVESRFARAKPALFKKKYGIENFILNVGHIGPERKNILRLMRALEDIDRQAVIIGRTEQTESGRECAQLARQNPRLLLIESIPHDSPLLASAYAACDVFALPSLFETPGIAALEAGLAGAKLAITSHGGTVEYFGTDATYVDPYVVQDIQKGILGALEKKKDGVLRERIKREYLWERVAEKTKIVYEQVLSSK